MVNTDSIHVGPSHGEVCLLVPPATCLIRWDLLVIVVQPLDLYLVNVGSIPTGLKHGEGRLHLHPGDVLRSTPNVRKSPRSGLNLEGRLSDPQCFFSIRPKGLENP